MSEPARQGISRARLRARLLGFVFQSFQLLPALNALENVMLPLELAGIADAEPRAAFANNTSADLVLSVHVDSVDTPHAAGCATFYYGDPLAGTGSRLGARFAEMVQEEICLRTDFTDCRKPVSRYPRGCRPPNPCLTSEFCHAEESPRSTYPRQDRASL